VRYVGVPMQKGSTQLKAKMDEAIPYDAQGRAARSLGQQYFGIDNFSAQLIDQVP